MSIQHRTAELRVKRKSLAAESKIIRFEIRRQKQRGCREAVTSLHYHRVEVVRPIAREAHLAACFLRGTPYAKCEPVTRRAPNLPQLRRFLERFCSMTPDDPAWTAWSAEARAHLSKQQSARELAAA